MRRIRRTLDVARMKRDLDQLPMATIATRDGVVVEANRAFIELAGSTSEDLVGKAMMKVLEPLVASRDREVVERVWSQPKRGVPGEHGSLWCRMKRPGAEERPVRMVWRLDDDQSDALVVFLDAHPEDHGQEVTDALGRVAGVYTEDVVARMLERERLAALGEAAGVMAHEVRNPVGAIMNALTLLDRDEQKSENARELLAIISEETTRLEQLVSQLLELGRPLFPTPRACSMDEITQNAIRSLGIRGELRKQEIDMPEGDRTVAWTDPDLAEVSLVNVLRNALQSTHHDGRIRIRIEQVPSWASWVVEDDGPGIPEETMKRIGEPFVTTRATGTGMGFAVVRRIMEASGGQLDVGRSDDLGGARVTLRYPRTATKPPG